MQGGSGRHGAGGQLLRPVHGAACHAAASRGPNARLGGPQTRALRREAVLRRLSGAATLGGALSEPREFVECVTANRGGCGRQVGRVGASQVGFGPHLRSGLHICSRLPATVPSDRTTQRRKQSAAWISLADRHLPGHGRHASCNGAFQFEPFSMAQPSCIAQAVTSH